MVQAPSDIVEKRKAHGWRHVRLSVVVPIGIIVAVAILCVVVAVLGSAQRADEVALNAERQLFVRALGHHAERVLRAVEGIATSEAGVQNIRVRFDPTWVQNRVGLRLQSLFDQDFVFVADSTDKLVYALLGNRSVDPNWFNSTKHELMPALDLLRGRATENTDAIALGDADGPLPGGAHHRAVRLQNFLGRPAIVAAVAVAARSDTTAYIDAAPPVVMSVKLIDEHVLDDITSRLQLQNLRSVDNKHAADGDAVFELADRRGQTIGLFAWTPKRPGAEIVGSVVPFMAIALAGFALLAALVLRHMRRTAAMIAAGESRLRHLALHDPLC